MENAPTEPVEAFVALGANLGDRLANLRAAVAALDGQPGITVLNVSPVYQTRAHTLQPDETQPDYLNAVLRLRTTLSLPDLLDVCQSVERVAGRDRRTERRWAPRPLDLDVLIFGPHSFSDERITVPHPRMAERRFVLCPLADLAPDRFVPLPVGATVRDLLARCPDPDQPMRTEFSLR